MAFQYTPLPQLGLFKSSLTYVPYFPGPIDHQTCQFSLRSVLWLKSLFIILMATGLGPHHFCLEYSYNLLSVLPSIRLPPLQSILHLDTRMIFLKTILIKLLLPFKTSAGVPFFTEWTLNSYSWTYKVFGIKHQLLWLQFLAFSAWILFSARIRRHSYQTHILTNYINLCHCPCFPMA